MPKGTIFGSTTREDIAWAAGLFDGEWCFSGKVVIVNTDISLLERFQNIFGFGRIYPRKLITNPNRKPQWQYVSTQFQEQQALIAFMWHWLSEKRRGQAIKLLDLQKSKGCRPGGIMCRRGLHRLEGDNVYVNRRANRENGNSFRSCLACRREYGRNYHAKK